MMVKLIMIFLHGGGVRPGWVRNRYKHSRKRMNATPDLIGHGTRADEQSFMRESALVSSRGSQDAHGRQGIPLASRQVHRLPLRCYQKSLTS
ncbi:hypothetical protein ACEQPO_01660 [Bacillus sp. SL00103]